MKSLFMGIGVALIAAVFIPLTPIYALANPAATWLSNADIAGCKTELRENENGQYTVVVFPDGTECSQWAYYCKCVSEPERSSFCSGSREESECDYPCPSDDSQSNKAIYLYIGIATASISIMATFVYIRLRKRKIK